MSEDFQRKRAWQLDNWKLNYELFSKEILFQTEPNELLEIKRELKETNPIAAEYLEDFQLLHGFLLKSESHIKAYIESKALKGHLNYFRIICENENKKDLNHHLYETIQAIKQNYPKETINKEELKMEIVRNIIEPSGWTKLIRVFEKIQLGADESLNFGEMSEIILDKDKFFKFEQTLSGKGYFSKQEGDKLRLEKDLKDLVAWGVFLKELGLIKHIEQPSKSKTGFNFSKFADYLASRYEGFKLEALKNKISPSRQSEVYKNLRTIKDILTN